MSAYSANKTINGLDAETTIADTDELVFGDVSDTNRAKKITFANFKTEVTGDDTAFVRKSDYDANTILFATTDNTPTTLTVGTNSVVGRVAGAITTFAVDSDLTAVSSSDDTIPSAKATKTALDLKAVDTAVVHNTGNETIAGTKTFSSDVLVPDEAYDATAWNSSLEVPTKNAIRDKFESLSNMSIDEVVGTNTGARTYWTSQLHIDADLGWTITTTTTENRANGVKYDANTNTSAYNTMKGDANSGNDVQWGDGIDFRLIYWFIPLNTSTANQRYFHGFADGASASQASDISHTADRRVGFIHSTGKIYTATCNGTSITTTEVDSTDDGTVKKIYEVIFTPSSVAFYVNGTLVATHTTNIPSGTNTVRIQYYGYDAGGGSSGFVVSHPVLGETLS